jgi:hypothetical protein
MRGFKNLAGLFTDSTEINKLTINELDILKSAEAQHIIADNIATDPSLFALKNRHKAAATLATQIKYLQRSKSKLPSFYMAKAIIPPLAFEQCSSERAASAKDFSGARCLDLTCGLGVDSWHFSKSFQQVTSIERNHVLAETVHYNFGLMNIHNINIINASAEDFVHNYVGEPFDLIYIDPARRDGSGKKVFLPEDCEPNFVALLPILQKIGRKIVIKMSPLYDVDAAARQFPDVAEIGVISVDNECKELLLVFETNPLKEGANPTVFIKCFYKNQFYIFNKNENKIGNSNVKTNETTAFSYIIEPDVAFYKARFLEFIPPQYFEQKTTILTASNGFFLSNNVDNLHDFPTRIFHVEAAFTYQPKKILAFLKAEHITALNVVQRNFPYSAADIRAALKVREGGDCFLICTVFQGEKWAWLAKKVV